MTERFGNPRLLAEIANVTAGHSGRFTCYGKNLLTGEEVGIEADAEMPTASVIKVPIMAVLYSAVEADEIDLDQRVDLTPEDWQGGTGVLKELMPGLQPTVQDLCRVMIILSDNIATKILVRLLGKERINDTLTEWGFPKTRVIMGGEGWGEVRDYAVSSPREIGRLMELIATGQAVSPVASAAMRDHLQRQQHLEQIPRGLPYSPYLDEIGMPQALRIGNKIGSFFGMRADTAFVEGPGTHFVLVTINEGNPTVGFEIDNECAVVNGRVGRAVFEAWTPESTQIEAHRLLRRGC